MRPKTNTELANGQVAVKGDAVAVEIERSRVQLTPTRAMLRNKLRQAAHTFVPLTRALHVDRKVR